MWSRVFWIGSCVPIKCESLQFHAWVSDPLWTNCSWRRWGLCLGASSLFFGMWIPSCFCNVSGKDFPFSIEFLYSPVQDQLLHLFESISGLSVVFHRSICLWFSWYLTVPITKALSWVLKSGNFRFLISSFPLMVCCRLICVFCFCLKTRIRLSIPARVLLWLSTVSMD